MVTKLGKIVNNLEELFLHATWPYGHVVLQDHVTN